MYRPLPNGLTIKNSPIEGLGLFSTIDIKINSFIGVTHIRDEQFENKYIRTPLGGFYNHSNNPNWNNVNSVRLWISGRGFENYGTLGIASMSIVDYYELCANYSYFDCIQHPDCQWFNDEECIHYEDIDNDNNDDNHDRMTLTMMITLDQDNADCSSYHMTPSHDPIT